MLDLQWPSRERVMSKQLNQAVMIFTNLFSTPKMHRLEQTIWDLIRRKPSHIWSDISSETTPSPQDTDFLTYPLCKTAQWPIFTSGYPTDCSIVEMTKGYPIYAQPSLRRCPIEIPVSLLVHSFFLLSTKAKPRQH